MTLPYGIFLKGDPDPDDVAVISRGLVAFNHGRVGADNYRPLTLLLRDGAGTLAGGLIGATYWGWLYVDMLWVRADARGQGHGHGLLAAAEQEARHHGCGHAYLDTFDFQALPFYRKRGYAIFGELPGFPAGHTRYFLTKELAREIP